jgi:type I restriction enzyme S subunit
MKPWPTRLLSDAYWFQEGPGVRTWQFRNEGIKLLNVANITKQGTLDLSKTDRYLSRDEIVQKYSHFLLNEGDLVIASSGISFDEDGLLRTRGAFVESQHLPLCLNTSTIRFKLKADDSTLSWLRYWLDSVEFREQITRLVTGSAQQNFGPSHLKVTTISLPPLAEQERIVKLLDEADELRKLRAQADRCTADLIPALFHEMFGDSGLRCQSMTIENAVDQFIDYRGKTPAKSLSGIPLVTARIVKGGRILPANEFIDEGIYDVWMRRGLPKLGDVLFTMEAPLGEVAIVHDTRIALAQRILLMRPRADLLDSRYFMTALKLPFVWKQIAERATGSTVRGIRQAELRKVQIPIPPLTLQKEFARLVTETRELETEQAASGRRLEDLFQSLLHRAFQGEL